MLNSHLVVEHVWYVLLSPGQFLGLELCQRLKSWLSCCWKTFYLLSSRRLAFQKSKMVSLFSVTTAICFCWILSTEAAFNWKKRESIQKKHYAGLIIEPPGRRPPMPCGNGPRTSGSIPWYSIWAKGKGKKWVIENKKLNLAHQVNTTNYLRWPYRH